MGKPKLLQKNCQIREHDRRKALENDPIGSSAFESSPSTILQRPQEQGKEEENVYWCVQGGPRWFAFSCNLIIFLFLKVTLWVVFLVWQLAILGGYSYDPVFSNGKEKDMVKSRLKDGLSLRNHNSAFLCMQSNSVLESIVTFMRYFNMLWSPGYKITIMVELKRKRKGNEKQTS